MSAPYQSSLFNWMVRHWICTFFLMGIGFVAFGVASLNLVQLFAANVNFLIENGWLAVMEDGLIQLAQLVFGAYMAVAFYLLFKTCEHALVERLAHYNKANKSEETL